MVKRGAAAKGEKLDPAKVKYTPTATNARETCDRCAYFIQTHGCELVAVDAAATGWCEEFEPVSEEKSMKAKLNKFIPFTKVDATRHEVWGIVTAEVPDKEDEVCDYARSKPFYEAVIAEMSKATDGKNFFPLREMHQLSAVGKGIGFEFRDDDKEIFMGFKVVDELAWKKVEEGVYTGFSHGGAVVGDKEPDPVYKGCVRYVASPSECSLVDNPCLGAAHFTYVKTDGTVELRKFKRTEDAVTVPATRFNALLEEVRLLKAKVTSPAKAVAKGKVKVVDGEELRAEDFIFVGNTEDPATWLFPVKFKKVSSWTTRYVRHALTRVETDPRIPKERRAEAVAKAKAAAIPLAIFPDKEKEKLAFVQRHLRKRARATVNRWTRKVSDVGHSVSFLDDDLGRLAKGLHEAGRLACFVQELGYMLYGIVSEEEWERDTDSALPAMLEENINTLLDTLIAMVAEEGQELREEIAARVSPA